MLQQIKQSTINYEQLTINSYIHNTDGGDKKYKRKKGVWCMTGVNCCVIVLEKIVKFTVGQSSLIISLNRS